MKFTPVWQAAQSKDVNTWPPTSQKLSRPLLAADRDLVGIIGHAGSLVSANQRAGKTFVRHPYAFTGDDLSYAFHLFTNKLLTEWQIVPWIKGMKLGVAVDKVPEALHKNLQGQRVRWMEPGQSIIRVT